MRERMKSVGIGNFYGLDQFFPLLNVAPDNVEKLLRCLASGLQSFGRHPFFHLVGLQYLCDLAVPKRYDLAREALRAPKPIPVHGFVTWQSFADRGHVR